MTVTTTTIDDGASSEGPKIFSVALTVRVWQGSEDGSYNYRHVLKDHTAEVLEAAKRLHLKEHAVCDGSGNIFKLAAPVECKANEIVELTGKSSNLDSRHRLVFL
ncbi:hypothetical protein NL676_021435 [Syzygium grande]|nr:hypothetical protein NL676_021435 [Syzygium grande]